VIEYQPRPAQAEVLSYQKGTLGIAAVPGSGKTWTLSLLAAELIDRGLLGDDQEILIVTLVNSAVDNFSRRISRFLEQKNRIPTLGYRVRTLHGLAHDILRERPELVGLDTQFVILDERETERIRKRVVSRYLREYPRTLQDYLRDDLDEKKRSWIQAEKVPELMDQFMLQYIRTAKDYVLGPADIAGLIKKTAEGGDHPDLELAELGRELYQRYQESLNYRGAVDFDDLIRLALRALEQDPEFLFRLQNKWPYILEDEAQDSSKMQERILQTLAGGPPGEHWVRVGDPNQAIYETFTTADPRLLIDFIKKADQALTLPNSGRSTLSIIRLANYLVHWVNEEHPVEEVRDALAENEIRPTPPEDAQANPPDKPDQIHLIGEGYTPQNEIQVVGKSVARWLDENPEKTAAVLVPRNSRGKEFAAHLRRAYEIEPVEHLNTTLTTRRTAGALGNILSYLSDPRSSRQLAKVFQVWRRADREKTELWEQVQELSAKLASCKRVEDFVHPGGERNWLADLESLTEEERLSMKDFREQIRLWLQAVMLPIDQLLLTISGELFTSSLELAVAHKLAHYLGQLSDDHPDWGLPALTDELRVLARNERSFFSFQADTGFDPDAHKGKVIVTTIHKAKGLEWDRVYIMAVNNYNFPSGESYDTYIAEKWFVREDLNLPAEGTGQLKALSDFEGMEAYQLGTASTQARLEYVRERLRLLYVAVTRAREELVITWNKGRRGNAMPALPLVAMLDYWTKESGG